MAAAVSQPLTPLPGQGDAAGVMAADLTPRAAGVAAVRESAKAAGANVAAVVATAVVSSMAPMPTPSPEAAPQPQKGMFTFTVRVCDTGHTEALAVRRGCCVKDVKDLLSQRLAVQSSRQRLFFRGTELANKRSLWESWVEQDSVVMLVVEDEDGSSANFDLKPFTPVQAKYRRLPQLIDRCRIALAQGSRPKLAEDGEGGTYFMPGPRSKFVLCFKPMDEEPCAPHNPKTFQGEMGQRGLREGIESGEAYLRECAAYCLDRDNFAGVPETMICKARHQAFNYGLRVDGSAGLSEGNLETNISSDQLTFKIGSLQEFIHFDGVAGDWGARKFPKHEVHKIGILDIRLLNLDRNDANILVRRVHTDPPPGVRWEDHRPTLELIPIDHGYCLPSTLNVGWCDWVWYEWPQAKEPFDDETLAYIASLDPDADARMLRDSFKIREECINTVRITGMLLKKGAAAGMTLYDIASLVLRDDLDAPSKLEGIVDQAFAMVEYHTNNHRLRGTPRHGTRHRLRSRGAATKAAAAAAAHSSKAYSTGTPGSPLASPQSPTTSVASSPAGASPRTQPATAAFPAGSPPPVSPDTSRPRHRATASTSELPGAAVGGAGSSTVLPVGGGSKFIPGIPATLRASRSCIDPAPRTHADRGRAPARDPRRDRAPLTTTATVDAEPAAAAAAAAAAGASGGSPALPTQRLAAPPTRVLAPHRSATADAVLTRALSPTAPPPPGASTSATAVARPAVAPPSVPAPATRPATAAARAEASVPSGRKPVVRVAPAATAWVPPSVRRRREQLAAAAAASNGDSAAPSVGPVDATASAADGAQSPSSRRPTALVLASSPRTMPRGGHLPPRSPASSPSSESSGSATMSPASQRMHALRNGGAGGAAPVPTAGIGADPASYAPRETLSAPTSPVGFPGAGGRVARSSTLHPRPGGHAHTPPPSVANADGPTAATCPRSPLSPGAAVRPRPSPPAALAHGDPVVAQHTTAYGFRGAGRQAPGGGTAFLAEFEPRGSGVQPSVADKQSATAALLSPSAGQTVGVALQPYSPSLRQVIGVAATQATSPIKRSRVALSPATLASTAATPRSPSVPSPSPSPPPSVPASSPPPHGGDSRGVNGNTQGCDEGDLFGDFAVVDSGSEEEPMTASSQSPSPPMDGATPNVTAPQFSPASALAASGDMNGGLVDANGFPCSKRAVPSVVGPGAGAGAGAGGGVDQAATAEGGAMRPSRGAWLSLDAPLPALTRVASYSGRGFASNSPNGRSTTSSTLLQALVHGTGRSNSHGSTNGGHGGGGGGGGALFGGGSGSLTPSASISDRTSVNAVAGDDVSVRANRPSAATSLRRRRQRAFHLTWARSHADAVELVQQFMGYLGARLDAEVDVWRTMRRIKQQLKDERRAARRANGRGNRSRFDSDTVDGGSSPSPAGTTSDDEDDIFAR